MDTNKDVNLTGEARKRYMETVAKKSVNLTEDERKAFVNALMRESVQATEEKPNRVYSQRGDDYLIEAQKVCGEDKREYCKPAPRCPYCGGEMDHTYGCTIEKHYYICSKCRAISPAKGRELESYTAAMQRWQEPNRVLTLDEVRERYEEGTSDSPLWIDFKQLPFLSRWYALQISDVFFATDTVEYYLTGQAEKYNFDWRCWLRKPTQEEREAAPWAEN